MIRNSGAIALSLSCLLLAQSCVAPVQTPVAQAFPNPVQVKAKMTSFSLSSQKDKNRVLLVFSPNAQNPDYQKQMQFFASEETAFRDRDLVLVQVLAKGESQVNGEEIDQASGAKLRDRFGIGEGDFRVILVGKDGGEKRTDTTPVKPKAIFSEIDAMPMRRQEMRDRHQ
jgi:Domain of unknown function (DUF4174)